MSLRRYLRAGLQWMGHPWALGAVVALAVLLAWLLGLGDVAELKLLDVHLRLRGPLRHAREVVVVAFGEDSFTELGQAWPWPRAVFAEAIERIQAARPKAIGVDVLFIEPSVFGPGDDEALAATLRKYPNVVLGALLERGARRVYMEGAVHDFPTVEQKLPVPPIRVGPYGFVNLGHDKDGFVRRAPLWLPFRDGERVEVLARKLLDLAPREGIRVRPPREAEILINFRGPARHFETVPFHQVLRGEIEPHVLAGKIVLIGSTSRALHDLFNTPFTPQDPMPGVEIQANVLDNLLRGDPLRAAPQGIVMALAVLAALLATFVTSRLRPLRSFLVVAGAALLYALVCYGALAWFGAWVEEVRVQLALFGAYGAVVVRNYVYEERAKRRLSRFFSPAVVQDILRHEDRLLSQRRKITILFSDIRNFTTISEKLAPETVVQALRLYFNTMTPIIFRNGGCVDKFVGDAIMAFFNAPAADPRHADHAVRTGMEMIQAAESLSPHWERMTGYPLQIGVGINTGEPVIGTMGSDQRLEYSCIGDAVNLAARLETLTREVKTDIVVSEHTYRELTERFPLRPLREVQVKGREQPVQVYAVDATAAPQEPGLKSLVDAALQTLSLTRAPSLTRRG